MRDDELREMYVELKNELRSGFSSVTDRIDSTNQRLDDTNRKLDETRTELGDRIDKLRDEMVQKFNGVGDYLESIDISVRKGDSRIASLEDRVTKIERRLGA